MVWGQYVLVKIMNKLILVQGIPGSGKSTWAKKWVEEDPIHRVRWNNDDCRKMCGPYWVPERETFIRIIKESFLETATMAQKDIVIDDMNLNPSTIEFYENFVKNYNIVAPTRNQEPYTIEYKLFNTPVEECIRRDALRENPIGEKTIKEIHKKYSYYIRDVVNKEILDKRTKIDDNLPYCVLLDIDNTISYSFNRPWYGEEAAKEMINDKVNEQLKTLVNHFNNVKVIIMSGRSNGDEANTTLAWFNSNNIHYDASLFRTKVDYRKGDVIKLENYNKYIKGKYNVLAAIEDDEECVKMYQEQGIFVLQPK